MLSVVGVLSNFLRSVWWAYYLILIKVCGRVLQPERLVCVQPTYRGEVRLWSIERERHNDSREGLKISTRTFAKDTGDKWIKYARPRLKDADALSQRGTYSSIRRSATEGCATANSAMLASLPEHQATYTNSQNERRTQCAIT